ncbi:hypothetical protein GCM10029963_65760 [Micromonospora andamanensis]
MLSSSRYVADLLTREPEALRLLAEESELSPRPREVLVDGLTAAAARHSDPVEATRAVRALRRRELLRLACADVLSRAGSIAPARPDGGRTTPALADVTAVGTALSDVTDATLAAALRTARAAQPDLPGLTFAVIGVGRLGGYESNYLSDADVLFVYEPRTGSARARQAPPRTPSPRNCGGCSACRHRTRRSASTPTCVPRADRGRWSAASPPTSSTTPAGRGCGRHRRCCAPAASAATPSWAPGSSG